MVVMVVALAIFGFGAGVLQMIPPAQRAISYKLNSLHPNTIPEPSTIVDMRFRKLITEDVYKEHMSKYGFSEENAELMFNSAQSLINASDLISAKRRGIVKTDDYYANMKRNHITQKQADTLEEIYKYIPSPQDFIRFAVREVFKPDKVQKFGMDEAFPTDIVEEILKIGMDEKTMRWYWRAHWELPGITAATDMFHRLNPEWEKETPVDEDTFNELLEVKDIMPYWKPRIKKVLYKLPTRVDIRRMLRDGHINPDETNQLYRMRGYNEENAKRMTDLAITYYSQDERKLSLSMILKALSEDEITEDESHDFVVGLGYTPEAASLIIRLKVIDIQDKEMDEEIKGITELYEIAAIDETELNIQLDALNISSTRKEKIIRRSTIRKRKKEGLPSKKDIEDFYTAQLIDKDTTEELLKGIGTREKDIPLYLELWGA